MNAYSQTGSIQTAEKVEDAVMNIKEFEDQLLFINENYHNLIFFDPLKGISFKRSPKGEEDYFLYTGDGITVSPNVSKEKLQLFKDMRNHQYQKLQAKIKSFQDYGEKLKYVMEFGSFKLGRVIICYDFWSVKNPVPSSYIDVGPKNPAELEIYNLLILHYIRESKKPGNIAAVHAYSFTSFDELKTGFETKIKKLKKRDIAAKDEILLLQKTLSYPDYSHEWRGTQLYLSAPLNKATVSNVFNFLYAGYSIDYRVNIKLSDLFVIVQAEECVRYYEYLVTGEYQLNKTPKKNKVPQKDTRTLFDVLKLRETIKVREEYYQKLIAFLKREHIKIDSAFIVQVKEELDWIADKVHAAGLMEYLRQNGIIEGNLGPLDEIRILNNTFPNLCIPETSASEYGPKGVKRHHLDFFNNIPK